MTTSQNSPPTHRIPDWPKVSAVVRGDGSGEVTVNGTSHAVQAVDPDGARAAVLHLVASKAAEPLGRPVRVDSTDPTGRWALIVHPNGHAVADDRQPPARRGAHRQPAAPPPRRVGTEADAQHDADVDPLFTERPPTDGPLLPGDGTPAPSASTRPPTPAAGYQSVATSPRNGPEPVRSHPDAAAPQLATTTPRLPAALLTPDQGTATAPAVWGWQGALHAASGGLWSPPPSPEEAAYRAALTSVRRPLAGPRVVVTANPKGGAGKSPAALLAAATFGYYRGGYSIAWDNNETRGTLGLRAQSGASSATVWDLLHQVDALESAAARVGDLARFVRSQGEAQFDVLASDEEPANMALIGRAEVNRILGVLARFYRVIVIDTGNNERAENWQAAIDAADQLLVCSTYGRDHAYWAAGMLEGLAANGRRDLADNAVTVLSAAAPQTDPATRRELREHFGAMTRAVVEIPYDPALDTARGAERISYTRLAEDTRLAWLHACSALAEGFAPT